MRNALYIVTIILGSLVLILSLAGIIGMWIAEDSISRNVVEVLNRVDRSAQVARDGVGRVDSRVSTARGNVQAVGAAADEISQNVGDRGLVVTLLPQEKEQQLQSSAEVLRNRYTDVRENVLATVNLIRAIGNLPFVEMEGPDPDQVQAVGDYLESLQAEIAQLNGEIHAFRESASGSISKIGDTADRIDGRLAAVQASLAEVDTRLAAAQTRARHLSQTVPTTLIVIASISTVLLLWVGFTQGLVVQGAWTRLRRSTGSG